MLSYFRVIYELYYFHIIEKQIVTSFKARISVILANRSQLCDIGLVPKIRHRIPHAHVLMLVLHELIELFLY